MEIPRSQPGESNPRAELTERDVDCMRSLRAKGWTYQRLAETFEVSVATAWRTCNYVTWQLVA